MMRKEVGTGALAAILTTLFHELVCQTEATVRAQYADACDVSVWDTIGRLFLHLAENVPYDPSLFVLGDVRELWPGQSMVEVVS